MEAIYVLLGLSSNENSLDEIIDRCSLPAKQVCHLLEKLMEWEMVAFYESSFTYILTTKGENIVKYHIENRDEYGNTPFIYKILNDVSITGGSWISASTESHVEYNITMTGFTGTGREYMQGVFTGGTAATPLRVLFKDFNSSYQLRTKIDETSEVFLIAVQATTNNDDAIASILWEEYN